MCTYTRHVYTFVRLLRIFGKAPTMFSTFPWYTDIILRQLT